MNRSKSQWGRAMPMFPQRLTTLKLLPKQRPGGFGGHWSELGSTFNVPMFFFSLLPSLLSLLLCSGEQILKEKRELNGVSSLIWWGCTATGPQPTKELIGIGERGGLGGGAAASSHNGRCCRRSNSLWLSSRGQQPGEKTQPPHSFPLARSLAKRRLRVVYPGQLWRTSSLRWYLRILS